MCVSAQKINDQSSINLSELHIYDALGLHSQHNSVLPSSTINSDSRVPTAQHRPHLTAGFSFSLNIAFL